MEPKDPKSAAAEVYAMIKEYSEYSTVAGLIYIFMDDQVLKSKQVQAPSLAPCII